MSERINAAQITEIMEERFPNVVTEDWFGVEVEIIRTISKDDASDFADILVQACFNEDGGYTPGKMDFALRSGIVMLYTNIDLPEDDEARYQIVYGSDLVSFIYENINQSQYEAIVDAASKRVRLMTAVQSMRIEKELGDMAAFMETISKQMEDVFGGITNADIEAVSKAISGADIDMDKLVEAYLKTQDDSK